MNDLCYYARVALTVSHTNQDLSTRKLRTISSNEAMEAFVEVRTCVMPRHTLRHTLVAINILAAVFFLATTGVAVAADVETACETTTSGDDETCLAPASMEETIAVAAEPDWTPVCSKEVVIPDGVTAIGDTAYSRCITLTSIVIPDSVTSIGYGAFHGCSSLTSIAIPDSVTNIGAYAFDGCTSLASIVLPDFSSVGGGASEIPNGAFQNCTSLAVVSIPNTVVSIGAQAFSKCSSLPSIVIPDSVAWIGMGAFYRCDSLATASIPSFATLDDDVFPSSTVVTTRD